MLELSSLLEVGATSHRFDSGEKVFKQDDAASHLFIVRSGRIQIVTYGTVLENVGPGGVFGEMALLDGATRAADAVATTDCALLPVSRTQFLDLVKGDPEFGLSLLKALGERLGAMSGAVQKQGRAD
jgi:CRP-like cAMP-binding protein